MNQRILVSAFIHQNNKVLLLKRANTQGFLADCWEMPGGKLEHGEDPVCGTIRETKEEAGIDCEVICPYHVWHSVHDYKGKETHFVEIDFICKMKEGQVKAGDGMSDAKWATKDEIETLKMSPDMKKAVLAGFEWHKKQQQTL